MNLKLKYSDIITEITKHNHLRELEDLKFKKAKDNFSFRIDSLNKWICGIRYFDEFYCPISPEQEIFKQYTIQKTSMNYFVIMV